MHKKFLKIYQTITIFLLIPTIIMGVIAISASFFNQRKQKKILISNYSEEMNVFYNTIEDHISKIYDSFSLINTIPEIEYYFNCDFLGDTVQHYTILNILNEIKNQHSILESILLFNPERNSVLTNSGSQNANVFFEQNYQYESYNYDFWMQYINTTTSSKILSPTFVSTTYNSQSLPILPVVCMDSSNGNPQICIYNINVTELYNIFSSTNFTTNSLYYMYDHNYNQIFIPDKSHQNPILDLSDIKNIDERLSFNTGETTLHGKRHYIIYSTKRTQLFGFSYAIAVPYSDINNSLISSNNNTIFFLVGLIVLADILILTFKVSKPLENLALILGENPNKKIRFDFLNSISTSVYTLIEERKKDAENLAITMPIAQQKYILSVLNSTENMVDQKPLKTFFKHPYFMFVIFDTEIRMNYSTDLPALYNRLFETFESILSGKCQTYISPTTREQKLHLILNLESISDDKQILEKINHIKNILKSDEKDITLYITAGSIGEGISGLKNSYNEATKELQNVLDMKQSNKLIKKELYEHMYTTNIENILFNHIISNDAKSANDFINLIFKECEHKNSENKSTRYKHLFNALINVIKINQLELADCTIEELSDKFIQLLTNKSDDSIQLFLIDLFDNMTNCSYSANKSSKLDVIAVVDYIKNYYADKELCLESLAEKFETNTKYISRRISQHLGVSFKDYLTNLRVTKVKELLLTDESELQDIAAKVGFNSYSTFNRVFVTKVGISPSKYRETYSKQ